MPIRQEIANLLKNNIVIRHRSSDEGTGSERECCICTRKFKMLPGGLCVAVGDDGILCSVCATAYSPELADKIHDQLPETDNDESSVPLKSIPASKMSVEVSFISSELNALRDVSNEIAKGIARGIVEAPAGHIGLLHFAKDIQKPPRKADESDKNYALRVRTHRMTKLYEIISSETVGRIDRIKAFLIEHGLLK